VSVMVPGGGVGVGVGEGIGDGVGAGVGLGPGMKLVVEPPQPKKAKSRINRGMGVSRHFGFIF
jgi:hypothetical protein